MPEMFQAQCYWPFQVCITGLPTLWGDDIEAGIILVNEAGGICLNEKGDVFDPLNDESLIASSTAISGELLKSL